MTVSRTPAEVAEAIDTVARHALRNAVFSAIASGRTDWGDYPELSEADWELVAFRARQLADAVDRDRETYNAAYDLLTERAGEHS